MGKYTSPAGRGDDGRAEWRQPVIVGQRFAERALANVAEIAPVAEAATGPAAEIQERRKRAADVARRRRAFVGSFSCPAVRLLRFRHIDLQRCLKGCGHGSSLCLCVFFLSFSFLPSTAALNSSAMNGSRGTTHCGWMDLVQRRPVHHWTGRRDRCGRLYAAVALQLRPPRPHC